MSILRDKSLREEGREAGWWRAKRRPFAEPGAEPHYGPDRAFELEHIDAHLVIEPDAGTVVGVARIRVGPVLSGLGPVVLDLDEVEVTGVAWDGAPVATRWRHEEGRLTVEPPDGADSGTVIVHYRAEPRRGLYFVGPTPAAPERPLEVWSQCQDEDAHYFLPCFDHPSVKHPWSFTIDAPADFVVVSNGALRSRVEQGDRVLWRWDQAGEMPAYLVTVVVAKLDVHEDRCGDLPLRYLVPPGTPAEVVARVFGKTADMVRCLERHFGVAYPWPRYDQVVVHEFIFGGMENVAATTLTDLVLTTERAARDYDPHGLVVHELAHQWFGDLVTCQDWSQGWLNEGWATYSEVLWQAEATSAEHAVWTAYDLAQSYFREASQRYCRPIVSYRFREPLDMFDRHLYEKGACVIHTLRHELGEEAFWPAVRSYLERHRGQSVHTRHFQRALEDATGRNLDGFFQQWVEAAGHPVVKVDLSHADGLLLVDVTQSQSGEGVPEAFRFDLRVQVVGEEGEQDPVDLPVRERRQVFALPCAAAPRWVRVDPGFRVLADLSLKAPGAWLRRTLAHDACPVARIRAAQALSRASDRDGTDALLRTVSSDPEWAVRAALAGLLGEMGGERCRDALLGSLTREQDARARVALVKVLGRFRVEVVEEHLEGLVRERDPSNYVEGEAGAALGRLRSPRARAACEALLGRPAWGEALAVRGLKGLGALRDPEVLPTLMSWTTEEHGQRARAAACGALAALVNDLPDHRSVVIERLSELALHGPFRVQLAAVSALGALRDPRGAPPLRRLHGGAGDGRVRRLVYEALQDIGEGRTSEAALQGLRDEVERLRETHGRLQGRLARLEPRSPES